MESKLEIKHLAAYLPHGLKVYDLTGEIHTMISVVSYGFNKHIMTNMNGMTCTRTNIEHCKPILHPLSKFGDSDDLRKVYEFIGLGKWCEAYDNYFNIWFDDLSNVDKLILQAPYEIFQYFLANHYDVFSLIPDNLAIDINTLNQ
jgi:hypothetical protein